MKVLLLGLTGNVGSRLLPSLVAHNHQVVAFVRSPTKISKSAKLSIDTIVVGSASDSDAIKKAILDHGCDAVVNAAGVAAMTGFTSQGEFPAIFAAVVKATSEASKERGGAPIRCWLLSGFAMLDGPKNPYLLTDFIPLFPTHKRNYQLIKSQSTENLAWSLFCAMEMPPKHKEPQFPPSSDTSADNLLPKADSPPAWSDKYKRIPLIGNYLNIMTQMQGYVAALENCTDFIARDLEKGLDSEWIGKRVGVKERSKIV